MGKRIIFCADGTWDSSTSHTNVYKFYKSLLTTGDQVAFYDDGVGAGGNPIVKLVGGAFGTGLWQKIKDGYKKIAHTYEAEDQVYLFGFSRGAFTARSLAGMIGASGLPTQNFTDDMVEIAFDAYRDKMNRAEKLKKLANCHMEANPQITMVGVWDTVGSLGIPSVIGQIDPLAYGFLDTTMNPKIKHGCQALAIDERRAQFPPTLWTGELAPDQTLEQVWFTGAHSDVGGGEPDDLPGTTALSDITLGWMMTKASAFGLQFDPAVLEQYTTPADPELALDKFHESWKVLSGFPIRRHIDKAACIANSVVVRCQDDSNWRPRNLTFVNGSLAPDYQIIGVVNLPGEDTIQVAGAPRTQVAGGGGQV